MTLDPNYCMKAAEGILEQEQQLYWLLKKISNICSIATGQSLQFY